MCVFQNRVVGMLVGRYGIRQQYVAVLSPYRAQCAQITESLSEHYPNVNVSTVVAAQGLTEFQILALTSV